MRIISASIVGNVRLLHKGTREVHYTPNEPIQLFIAKNGYGKSTLLRELSPLPAESSDYVKGGYKEIVIEHNGRIFKLRSEFASGKKHYFQIDDGENLNAGHTVTVQKQLVEQYLEYTDVIHGLIMGDMPFTTMTPKHRRDVLIKLCDVDVTYALELHKQLTTELRNVQGAFKINQDRLYEVSSTLPQEDEINQLQDGIERIQSEVRKLLELKSSSVGFTEQNIPELEAFSAKLDGLGRDLITTPREVPNGIRSIDAYREHNQLLQLELRQLETNLDGYQREHANLNDTMRLFREDEQYTIEDIYARIELIKAQRNAYEQSVPEVILGRKDASETLSEIISLYEDVDAFLLALPLNENMAVYNRETITANREKRAEYQTYYDRAINRIAANTRKLDHMTEAKEQKCPKCEYVWIPGWSDIEAERLKQDIATYEAKVVKIEAVLKEVDHFLEDAEIWMGHYRRFQEWTRQYPRLQYFWNYYVQEYRIFNQPKSLVGWMQMHIEYFQKAIEYQRKAKELDEIESLLEQKQALEGKSKTMLCDKIAKVEEQIQATTRQLLAKRDELQRHERNYANLNRALAMSNALKETMETVKGMAELYYDFTKNRLLEQVIDEQLAQSAALTKRLNDAKTAMDVYKHLERSQGELSTSASDYLALTEALSPVNGLIADSLTGFINNFVGQMNHVIEQIWTSGLYVLPCSYEHGSLDYRFPLVGADKDKPTPDVGLGSKGEKELIDFVFMLIARRYLKVEHFPLFMDEVGSSFFEDNRVKLYNYLKLLVDTGRIHQAFVVSHIANSHAVLHRVDTNVLDPTGIMITEGTNRQFRIS